MAKFHILEVREGKETFREVEREAVQIGGIVPGFLGHSYGNDFAAIFDATTGSRVSHYEDSHEEALEVSESWLAKNGILRWHDSQLAFSAKYGRPPEPENEIVQDPQEPGELEAGATQ